jgi:ATP synthase protein I
LGDERDGFERRLREARARQGLDKPAGGDAGGGLPPGPWGIGFRAGVEVVSALAVGVVIGLLLDRWLGTWPWLFLLFFVAGSAAGILNVYRLFSPRRAGRRDDKQAPTR